MSVATALFSSKIEERKYGDVEKKGREPETNSSHSVVENGRRLSCSAVHRVAKPELLGASFCTFYPKKTIPWKAKYTENPREVLLKLVSLVKQAREGGRTRRSIETHHALAVEQSRSNRKKGRSWLRP
jgi:hypothetical protein